MKTMVLQASGKVMVQKCNIIIIITLLMCLNSSFPLSKDTYLKLTTQLSKIHVYI